MSSQWLNKFAIMRDLSLAQGCLPVDVAGTVGAGEKPPSSSLNFKEDTEEEFYKQWVGGNGDLAPPDLGLIKDMLEMVRNHDSPPNDDEDSDNIIQIRKINPESLEFKPRVLSSGAIVDTNKEKQKKKKPRNVAMQSLLNNIEEAASAENKQSLKLLKPTDFSTKPYVKSQAVEKVFGWLQIQPSKTPSPIKKNKPMLDINPMNMFRKKTTSETVLAKPVKVNKKTSSSNFNKYVPSKAAEEYYKKFVECSEMHRMVEKDVWTKVERQMKEIDERRKAEAELFSLSLALCSDQVDSEPQHRDPVLQKLAAVSLPRHRHQLAAVCAVCAHRRREKQPGCQNNLDKDNDDPWWNWRDPNQNVEDNWRNQTVVLHGDNIETDKENIETAKGDIETDNENIKTDKGNIESNKENIETDKANIETGKENIETDKENRSYFLRMLNRGGLGIKPSSQIQPKKSFQLTKEPDSCSIEEVISWTSHTDDADEIDAWRYEILSIEDYDKPEKKVQKADDETQYLDVNDSWQNEEHIKLICHNIEKRRSVLGKKEVNAQNEAKNVENEPDLHLHLNSTDILRDNAQNEAKNNEKEPDFHKHLDTSEILRDNAQNEGKNDEKEPNFHQPLEAMEILSDSDFSDS